MAGRRLSLRLITLFPKPHLAEARIAANGPGYPVCGSPSGQSRSSRTQAATGVTENPSQF
jgi:hypothetical protein